MASSPEPTERLTELRKVAEAADDGGRAWTWKGGYPQTVLREGDVILVAQTFTDPDHVARFAEFISTFDPPTVLRLLMDLEFRTVADA
jgi:hypothetical protein